MKNTPLKFTFVLRTITSWLDPTNSTSWCSLEENVVHPHRLQDLIYAEVPLKQAKMHFVAIIANVTTWKLVALSYPNISQSQASSFCLEGVQSPMEL